MKTNNLAHVEYVSPNSINRNVELGILYRIPSNYEMIKENISTMGIITPLIVNSFNNVIVSGNLRHMIAIELGIPIVPVFFVNLTEDMRLVSLSSNVQRGKSTMDKYREMMMYKEIFPIKRGNRTDLFPELKELIKERDIAISVLSKDTRDKLSSIGVMCNEMFPLDPTKLEGFFNEIDSGKSSLNKVYKKVKNLNTKSKCKNEVVGGHYKEGSVTIYNKSSETMEELEDESLNVCIGSPVYWRMKVYQLPSNQLGLENTVEEYINNLKKHYSEVFRVLKNDGIFYLNAPSNGPFHRYPKDYYRFYPDSCYAIKNWAKYSGYKNIIILESYTSKKKRDYWNDNVSIFLKHKKYIIFQSKTLMLTLIINLSN